MTKNFNKFAYNSVDDFIYVSSPNIYNMNMYNT